MKEKLKRIFANCFVPFLFGAAFVCIIKGDYHRANYFILLYLGILITDSLNEISRNINYVWGRLYKKNQDDGIE